MKRMTIALGLLFAVNSYAQYPQLDETAVEGMPTITIVQHPCIMTEEGEDVASARIAQHTAATQQQACLSAMGSPKILVCLADFPDVKFSVGQNADAVKDVFDVFFNGNGIGAGDNPHSVSDYFREMSAGLFNPEFIIMDAVTLSHERKYYGEVSGSSRRTTYRNEALTLLAPQVKDRIEEFDTNGDGKIDGVIIVFPGCGANVGDNEGMHPVCWTGASTISGVTYATELLSPELLGKDEKAKINGIGVFVHEMSHMLGLPDFYDLNYKAPGMDYWSLMDYGEYWQNGYRPTPYTAYERNFMGWMPLVELSQPLYVPAMKSVADGGSAYIIYNEGNRNEYYILENRNSSDSWSASLCGSLGSGLMIYHVDYDASAWSSNRINTNINRQRMTIVPANGHFELSENLASDASKYISELRGHLWPLKENPSVVQYWGIAGNNELTDTERTDGDRVAPAAVLHTPNADGTYLMHKPLTRIAFDSKANTVSFSFMGGTAETGINDIENGADSWQNAVIKVYTADGRLVAKCHESQLDALSAGVYVLRNTVTGETAKRFIGNL